LFNRAFSGIFTMMNVKQEHPFFTSLQKGTEAFLTRRQAVRRVKKEKQRAKNPILDWIEAFLWAAGVVLLINQYLFQAYQIPSGSMIDTLLVNDRIFANKVIYGPELLPGVGKLKSPIQPKRGDVIIFENPEYFSNGTLFDIAQRIIYMLTFSLVDIDRAEDGRPMAHFLIKRAAGMEGDVIETRKGELYFCFAGENRWISERDYVKALGFKHRLSRQIEETDYPALEAMFRVKAYQGLGVNPPQTLLEKASVSNVYYGDAFAQTAARYAVLRGAFPQDKQYRAHAARQRGWYVPEGRILPLGDNRDNSHDGRFFGSVKASKILGQGSFKYWPPHRWGVIR
jgi:signal peptidase I